MRVEADEAARITLNGGWPTGRLCSILDWSASFLLKEVDEGAFNVAKSWN
jgi:hypothetical protein